MVVLNLVFLPWDLLLAERMHPAPLSARIAPLRFLSDYHYV
ncbi:hypothetical protein [Erwinia tracheiphila]|nr:hypothetical protein [Erwinia tracheiphila]